MVDPDLPESELSPEREQAIREKVTKMKMGADSDYVVLLSEIDFLRAVILGMGEPPALL